MSNDKRIGDLLVEEGVVSRDALESLLERKPLVADRRLLSEIYAAQMAPERRLAEILARRAGAPVAVLTESTIDLDVLRMVPLAVVQKNLALPVAADDTTVTVVTPDAEAPDVTVPLGFATGRRVVLILGIHSVLEEHLAAALAAMQRGEKLYVGAASTSSAPRLEVARYAPSVSLEEANAIARAIVEALGDPGPPGPAAPPSAAVARGAKLGALRLKQMLIEQPREKPVEIVEKPLPLSQEVPQEVQELELMPVAYGKQEPVAEAAPTLKPTLEPVAEVSRPVVLLVEDDAAIRKLLAKAFQFDGLKVVEAEDGTAAVTLLRTTRPDVVVLDAMLPGVHGFEICAGIKRSALHDVPVIMVSAIYRGWERAREIQEVHGADYFVEKPFELTYVRKLVAEVLRRPHALPRAPVDESKLQAARLRYEQLAAEGRFQEAGAFVAEWLSFAPFDGRAWLERGNLCAYFGDLVGAVSAFESAVVYEPGLLVGHLGLAMSYERLGFVRRARMTWQKARALAPDAAVRAQIDAHLR